MDTTDTAKSASYLDLRLENWPWDPAKIFFLQQIIIFIVIIIPPFFPLSMFITGFVYKSNTIGAASWAETISFQGTWTYTLFL
jgi:hypothetical protein